MKSFRAWVKKIFFKYAMATAYALFGREVTIEGSAETVRIFPIVWKKRLHLLGLVADHVVAMEFVSGHTVRIVSAPLYLPGRSAGGASPPAKPRVAHIMLGHMNQPKMDGLLDHARVMGPDYELILAYGGKREEFDKITYESKIYMDDPSLRGPHYDQSYNQIFTSLSDYFTGRQPPDWLFLGDYDTVPLRQNYLDGSIAAASEWRGGFFGKSIRDLTYSNSCFVTASATNRHLGLGADDPLNRDIRIYHSLGAALLISWKCFCDMIKFIDRFSKVYFELALPTAAALAGHPIRGMDACCTEWKHIRYRPFYQVSELEQLQADGFPMAHPVKDIDGFLALVPALQKGAGVKALVSQVSS